MRQRPLLFKWLGYSLLVILSVAVLATLGYYPSARLTHLQATLTHYAPWLMVWRLSVGLGLILLWPLAPASKYRLIAGLLLLELLLAQEGLLLASQWLTD